MQEAGYDAMSDELNEALENLEYDIATSSEKQLSIVQSMLNQMVNSYAEAYNKIDSIINETGFVGTSDFDNTVENISTSSGASSISSSATQSQSDVKPSDSASNINSSNVSNDNHTSIENEVSKEPNTDNRPVAELKLSPTSVTLEEGKSTSVSSSIRPTDAKNKTLSWKSSNTKIATVSNGTIKAISPGSCQVTASTTDGSGISASVGVTVTKKPEPVKNTSTSTAKSTQGDGVPNVGDKVTFVSGRYYYDSNGKSPTGNQMLGKSVYITKINKNGSKPYHISRTNKLGGQDLGWLTLSQLKGYKRGSRYIDRNQWAWTQEDGKEEVIFRASDGAMLTPLNNKDMVFSNDQVQYLWEMSKGNLSPMMNLNTENMLGRLPNVVNRNDMSQQMTIEQHYDSLLTVNGNVDKDALPGLKELLEKSYKYTSDKMAKDLMMVGYKVRR